MEEKEVITLSDDQIVAERLNINAFKSESATYQNADPGDGGGDSGDGSDGGDSDES